MSKKHYRPRWQTGPKAMGNNSQIYTLDGT